MGELARQRRARDLWISRGHLWALGAGIVLAVVLSFFLGMLLAGDGSAAPAHEAASLGVSPPEESLVDLLARVDARVVAQDGVDTLTFPDTLTGVAGDPDVPAPSEAPGALATVAPGDAGSAPADLVIDAPDADQARQLATGLRLLGWTVQVHEAELRVDGGATVDEARERVGDLRLDLQAAEHGDAPIRVELRRD